MHTKVLSVDDCCDRELIEGLHDFVIEVKVIHSDALLTEVVHLGHLS